MAKRNRNNKKSKNRTTRKPTYEAARNWAALAAALKTGGGKHADRRTRRCRTRGARKRASLTEYN